jgi:hypothetical protein
MHFATSSIRVCRTKAYVNCRKETGHVSYYLCSTLTANIRHRRGRKVCVQLPLFMDYKTNAQAVTTLTDKALPPGEGTDAVTAPIWEAASSNEAVHFATEATNRIVESGEWDLDHDVGDACVARARSIHMDCMAFGMGCCCLQV